MLTRKDIIDDLVSRILEQEEEIKTLNQKIKHIKQYIEVYEEYIKRENNNGDKYSS